MASPALAMKAHAAEGKTSVQLLNWSVSHRMNWRRHTGTSTHSTRCVSAKRPHPHNWKTGLQNASQCMAELTGLFVNQMPPDPDTVLKKRRCFDDDGIMDMEDVFSRLCEDELKV